MIIIERCEKKPGIFVGARTYRLVLNDEGLYVLELGKAMGSRNQSNAIADKILDRIQENREKQHAEKEKELGAADLKQLVDNKKNFLIRKSDIQEITFTNHPDFPKLYIKSGVLKITLHFYPEDSAKVGEVSRALKP